MATTIPLSGPLTKHSAKPQFLSISEFSKQVGSGHMDSVEVIPLQQLISQLILLLEKHETQAQRENVTGLFDFIKSYYSAKYNLFT